MTGCLMRVLLIWDSRVLNLLGHEVDMTILSRELV